MANNPDTPNGLKPVRYQDGSPYNGAHNLYAKLAGYGTAIFIGDVVQLADVAADTGVRIQGMDVEGMPAVELYAVNTDMIGVVVGFLPNPDALGTNHSPASTAAIVMVADDPNLIFEAQEDGVGGTYFTADMVGSNVDILGAIAGNTTTGQSIQELDSSVTPVSTTAGFRLMRLVPRPGNILGVTATPNARWEVMPVEHTSNSRTGNAA
jgi:hypothetical protein